MTKLTLSAAQAMSEAYAGDAAVGDLQIRAARALCICAGLDFDELPEIATWSMRKRSSDAHYWDQADALDDAEYVLLAIQSPILEPYRAFLRDLIQQSDQFGTNKDFAERARALLEAVSARAVA